MTHRSDPANSAGPPDRVREALVLAGLGGAILATLAFAFVLVRAAPGPLPSNRPGSVALAADDGVRSSGVRARITAGEVTVQRALPAPTFALEPGQSLDARLPAGPFEATITIGFNSGPVRMARLGARIRGGSIIVRRGERVICSDHAGDEPRLVLSQPIALGLGLEQIICEFHSDGAEPCALQAMWEPEASLVALPLDAPGARLDDDPALAGLVLAQTLECAACHRSADPELQAMLEAAPAPLLGQIGARARPSWLRRWIADPNAIKPEAPMPRLFGEGESEQVEDLTHFLVSMGGPIAPAPEIADHAALSATGRALYHDVGCVACHGPRADAPQPPAAAGDAPPAPRREFASLDHLPAKSTASAVAAFLEDPLAVRPSGRMPSMLLSATEARSLAVYLTDSGGAPPADEGFTLDPQRVERGRGLFAARGCASCHELGPDRRQIEPTLRARPLESLAGADLTGGCAGVMPQPSLPHFAIDDGERVELASFLASLDERRCDDVPHDRVAATLLRLQCTACHAYEAQPGAEPAVERFFATIGEADLGDEGRLPPELGGVGARLNPLWLREVLETGARARPYLSVRMPVFGGAVEHLVHDLPAVAGALPEPAPAPAFKLDEAHAGRELVGAGGFNCIQCHDIAGRAGTGTPGPDLAGVVERLRYETFERWLHDPSALRPGTRMPSFFIGGRSGVNKHFDGRADDQVRAIWSYLSQGPMLPLPEGMLDPAGLTIDVSDEPVVLRTFMTAAGVRAIACGFPEQVHCAFDADRCRLAAIWQGQFLDASGAWAARGGSLTDPEAPRWTAGDEPVLRLAGSAAEAEPRFLGYRLDEQRRPILLYELRSGGAVISVTEQPIPLRDDETAGLRRVFTVSAGQPVVVTINAPAEHELTEGEGSFEQRDGMLELTLDENETATFELEVRW